MAGQAIGFAERLMKSRPVFLLAEGNSLGCAHTDICQGMTREAAVRRRAAPRCMAGKAIAFERGMGGHEVARTDHLMWLDDAERNDGGQNQTDQDQEGALHFHPQNRNIAVM